MSDGDLKGKIKSVTCRNFVTYSFCIFNPTNYLNVIIGPNGTGKSTLVAAIVLGLGGEPKVLSRASTLQDYIKNGKNVATICIELYKNNRGQCGKFQRHFNESGKSEFKINEKVVTKANFLSEIRSYRIQVCNLCQFLPQDRVQDFAKMDPQEIFLNTIGSVCSEAIIDTFNQMKALRKSQMEGQKSLANSAQRLKDAILRVEELKQLVERHKAREEYLTKLNVCNAKKKWLEIEEVMKKTTDLVEDLTKATKVHKEKQKIYNDLMVNQQGFIKKSADLTEVVKKKEHHAKLALEAFDNASNDIVATKATIRDAKINLDAEKRELVTRRKDLNAEIQMIDVLQVDLNNALEGLGTVEEQKIQASEFAEKLEDLKQKISKLVKMRSDINRKLDSDFLPEIQMIKTKIERSKNVSVMNMQRVGNIFPNLIKGVQFIQENRHLFSGRIYNPVLLELSVRDPNHAKYIENSVPLRDLQIFLCENKEDVSLLVDELCIKRKLFLNVGHAPSNNTVDRTPPEPLANLKQFGFTSYLIDLFDGPPAVVDYLCSLYGLHCIPIGTKKVEQCTDEIPNTIRQYYGDDQKYSVSISKYSKESSLMQFKIKGKELLCCVDPNEEQQLLKRRNELQKKNDTLKNERTSIEVKINEIEFKRDQVVSKKRDFEGKQLFLEDIKKKLNKQKLKVAELKKNMKSATEMDELFKTHAKESMNELLELQDQRLTKFKMFQNAVNESKLSKIALSIYKQQHVDMSHEINEAESTKSQSQKLCDSITNILEKVKKSLQNKKTEAMSMTNNLEPKHRQFPNKDLYDALPNSLDELTDHVNDYSARLDCIADVDKDSVKEYTAKCAEVDSIKKSIEDSTTGDKAKKSEISKLHDSWFPDINSVIDTINSHFGDFMNRMDYVGEVTLIYKDLHDFDSYGIQIMVQYRANVRLQALDRHVQSGGERAVAIALYTLAMQHITNVPFRCVDEINQGMDARNERKIFEMLLDETTQPGRPQYFFVTPKLLDNLSFNERMTVHPIYNGKHQHPASFGN